MPDDDLFSHEPSRNARNTDPPTSHKAAIGKPYRMTDRARVWATHRDAYPSPLADYQMEAIIGMGARNGKFRKRRSDLKVEGVLIASGLTAYCKESSEDQIRWLINPALLIDGKPPWDCPKKPKKPPPRSPSPYDNLDD